MMKNNSYEQYLLNELKRVKEENKKLKDKFRVDMGEYLMLKYEDKIKEIMKDSPDMTKEEKKDLRNLMFSAIGDLDILILFDEKDWYLK